MPITFSSTRLPSAVAISFAFQVNSNTSPLSDVTLVLLPARTSEPFSHSSARLVGVPVPLPDVRRTCQRKP